MNNTDPLPDLETFVRRPHDPEDDSGNEQCSQVAWSWRRGHGSSDGGHVRWEGCVEFEEGSDGGSDGGESLARTRSLMDGDLKELKGCLDLGFGFSYDEIPGLCAMLPALELCYSMSRLLGGGAGNAGEDADESYEAITALPIFLPGEKIENINDQYCTETYHFQDSRRSEKPWASRSYPHALLSMH
ncbi:hypothetical protein ZIOFF_028875 [Zingiber officinale]|uniref:Uncharacterized protein n=1 Tax=Zingiber officinale TaxID=94328 RepID=A0A8J5LA59_ZINOF|nr:hypothetical protein ZIOFF_028875 [Zingiber officinale]